MTLGRWNAGGRRDSKKGGGRGSRARVEGTLRELEEIRASGGVRGDYRMCFRECGGDERWE